MVQVNAQALADLLDSIAGLKENGLITRIGWTYAEALTIARDLLDEDPLVDLDESS